MPYFGSRRRGRAQVLPSSGESCSKNRRDPTFSGLRHMASYSSRSAGVSNQSGGTLSTARARHSASRMIDAQQVPLGRELRVAAAPHLRLRTWRRPWLAGGPRRGGGPRARGPRGELLLERLPAHPRALAHHLEVQVARDRIAGGADRREQSVQRLPLMLDSFEPTPRLQQLDLPLQDIERVSQHLLQRCRAARAHQRVGILARRERRDPDPHAVPEQLVAGPKAWPGAPPCRCRTAVWRMARSAGAARPGRR